MLGNGILETTTTTGTGDLTTSAVTGRPRFTDKFTANATEASAGHFYYAILTNDSTPQFIESGIGYMSAVGTLKRIVILSTYASSTYNDTTATAATLAAGTKNVICTGEAGALQGVIPGMSQISSAVRYAYSAHVYSTGGGGTLACTANLLYFQPFLHVSARPIDALFIRASTGSSINAQIGLYECNRDGTPGRKIMGSTADTAMTGGNVYTVTTGGPVRLAPGWYFLGFVAATGLTVNAQNVNNLGPNPLGTDGVQYPIVYVTYANGSTTLPDPAPTPTAKVTNIATLAMGVRYAA